MSKYKILFFVFGFCIPGIAASQDNSNAGEMRTERTKKVKMPKYYKASLPKKSIAVAGIQILQVVSDSTRLGYLQKGLDNQKVTAIPAENLTFLLQQYITKQYESDYKEEGIKILLVVKNLRINERTFFSAERAFARLHADSYISNDGNSYSFATSIDTVQVFGSALDVTAKHGENIAAALHKLIVQTLVNAQEGPEKLSGGTPVDTVVANVRKVVLHPIHIDGQYREGVYLGFQEFLQNNPSLKKYEVDRESKGTLTIYSINPDSTKTVIKPWGLCNKGELYKYHESTLVPIEKYGNEFVISGYIDKANRRNQSLFAGAFIGGLAGAAIANATADRLHSVTMISYITKKQPEASMLDLKSGEFTF